MRIVILTDPHFGVRDDSAIFLQHQKKFFDEVFFPYIEENNVYSVMCLGDTFDRRKSINYSTLKHIREFFFDKITNKNIDLHILVGNHDTYFKNSHEVNSYDTLFADNQKINIISEPQDIEIDGVKFLAIPWINRENEEICTKAIEESDAEYLLGHFEITGMKLHRNWEFHKGMHYDMIKKFKEVWSGHYHLRLSKNNFKYLGTPYQMDWADLYEKKGFYIFDTETKKLKFIENPFKLFKRIVYDGTEEIVEGCFVKVILEKPLTDYVQFEVYIKHLEELNHKVSVDEQFVDDIKSSAIEEMINVEDTFQFLEKAINNIESIDHEALKEIMKTLYTEAKEQAAC